MARPLRAVPAVLAGIAASILHVVPSAAETPAYAWTAIAVQQPPATMHPGQVVTLTIALRNDGAEPWLGEGTSPTPMRLATAAPRDRVSAVALEDPSWLWSGGRRIRMATPYVPSGGVGTFTFTFRAPSTPPYPRNVVESFAPHLEGAAWLDDHLVTLTTRVIPASSLVPAIPSPDPVPSPPPPPSPDPTVPPLPTPTPAPGYDWELVAATPAPAAMHPGMKVTLAVTLRNTGDRTWFAEEGSSTPMRLAAVHAPGVEPRERASVFGRDDPTWLWSGGRRIRMTTPQVEPGGIGTFAFTFTAPTLPSYPQTFVERFAPIVEGVALLDPSVVTFTTQVRPANGAVPPIPELPGVPSPSPLPTIVPSPLPTPSTLPTPTITPSPLPSPTLPPLQGTSCPTTATVRAEDLLPPALALGYSAQGQLLAGRAQSPSAVAFGFAKLFVTDPVNDRIVKTDPAGFVVDTFGSSGSGDRQLRGARGIAITDTAVVFVSDTGNDRISSWGLAGVWLGAFGGTGDAPGRFRAPHGISVIPNGPLAGNLAIADTGNDRIQIVSRTGTPIAVIGGPGSEPGRFSSPTAVSVWGNSIFVADTGNQRIQRLALDGTPQGVWGGPGTEGGCTAAPTGILATAYGVFVTEAGTGRIERFTRWGLLLETFGQIAQPASPALDPAGGLYVPEGGADRIVRYAPVVAVAPPLPG